MPPTIPSRPIRRLQTPRAASVSSSVNKPMAQVVVYPLVTNQLEWMVGIPAGVDPQGKLVMFDGPVWVWIERCNHVEQSPQIWTNVWDGPLPYNHTIDFVSIAPANVHPEYRFTLSFQNGK